MIIGHEEIIKDFKKLADARGLAHGYILFGPPRIGKKLFALHLANYFETGSFSFEYRAGAPLADLILVSPGEEKSVGIDQIREIKNFLRQMPNRSPYRTVVIDEAERMTDEAQNALLRVAEEPTSYALILVVVDDAEKLYPTLRSRLQRIYFGSVPQGAVAKWLKKEFGLSTDNAKEVAEESFGQPGLAWRLIRSEEAQKLRERAAAFLRMGDFERRAFIKKLGEDETFDFDAFLEMLIMVAFRARKRADHVFMHRLFELRRQVSFFSLNPKLQLTALAQLL